MLMKLWLLLKHRHEVRMALSLVLQPMAHLHGATEMTIADALFT